MNGPVSDVYMLVTGFDLSHSLIYHTMHRGGRERERERERERGGGEGGRRTRGRVNYFSTYIDKRIE